MSSVPVFPQPPRWIEFGQSGRRKIVSRFVFIGISFTLNEAGQIFMDLALFVFSTELSVHTFCHFKIWDTGHFVIDL